MPVVGVGRYQSSPESLGTLVETCEGFAKLSPGDRVLIKPNLVGWEEAYPVAPYGVYTTSRIVEDLIRLLQDAGAGHVTVGEGSVRWDQDDPGTSRLYEVLGYAHLKRRYGVGLVDLLDGPFVEREVCGLPLEFSAPALEADFLVNLPVLKTHNQTRLSLGLKNLKGCLGMKSRQLCHHEEMSLDGFVAGLVGVVHPDLTVIDGIYGLERGPFVLGRARRMDALVASNDPHAADQVAATLAGFDPAEVPHLAGATAPCEIRGEEPATLARPLAWDFDWQEDPARAGPPQWEEMGISGVSIPKYDASLCTGCSVVYNPLVLLITSAFKGEPFSGFQVLTGKKMEPAAGFEHTLLVGNCMIKRNREHPALGRGVMVPGCPPPMDKIVSALRSVGLRPEPSVLAAYRKGLVARYRDDPDFDPAHFFLPGAKVPAWLQGSPA